MNHSERRKYAKHKEQINRKFETVFYPKVVKEIKKEISSLIDHMRANGVGMSYFDNHIASDNLGNVIEGLYKRVGVYHANYDTRLLRTEKSFEELETKGFGFNEQWVNFIINYFKQHLVQYITFGSVQTMRDYFLPIISKAINEGTPFEELAREIEEKGFEKWQAARIVRTEVNSAASLGTVAAGSTYEYETNKEWISAMDSRVRGRNPEDHANHWDLDGVVVDYNQPFVDPRNGVRLMQPGDPKAQGMRRDKAATVINCRCTVALVAKRDGNDRLIPKTSFIKSAEPEKTKELKPDYSEIIEPIDYLKDEIRDIGRGVRGIKETDLSPVLERFGGLATKEDLDEIKLLGQLISGEGERQVEAVTKVKDELERLIEEKLNGDLTRIGELIDLVNSKDYKPEIVLNSSSKSEIDTFRAELAAMINLRFDELLKEVMKKRKYRFDVVKDSNDLIISATAQQV